MSEFLGVAIVLAVVVGGVLYVRRVRAARKARPFTGVGGPKADPVDKQNAE